MSTYEVLASINVNEHKSSKNGFDYLSWADAVDTLQQHLPEATWTVREWDGLPFVVGQGGAWVCVTVTIGEVERTQWHPVLDHRNKTIPAANLDVFAVNKSIQRALAKAIALHGLGLYIFRGEDLPEEGDSQPPKAKPPKAQKVQPQGAQDAERHSAGVDAVLKAAAERQIPQDALEEYVKATLGVEAVVDLATARLRDLYKTVKAGEVDAWLNARVAS